MKINIIIPTYEPSYKEVKGSQKLKEFYLKNFQSWIDLSKENSSDLIKVIFSDFKSSKDFLNYIIKPIVEKNKSVIAIFGEQKLSSTDALNIGLSFDKKADIYIYAASDTKIHKGWLRNLNLELSENQHSTILFTTSLIGSSEAVDQVQKSYINKPAKILSIEEQPIPNVVILRSSLLKAYDYKIGNTTTQDLGFSLTWLALSLGSLRCLSYRLFIEHDFFTSKGRHDRSGEDSYGSKFTKKNYQKIRNVSKYIHLFEGYAPPSFKKFNFISSIKKTAKLKKRSNLIIRINIFLVFLIPTIIKDIYYSTILPFHFSMISKLGFFNYIFQRKSAERKIGRFIILNQEKRINLCKKIFFHNGYNVSYKIHKR